MAANLKQAKIAIRKEIKRKILTGYDSKKMQHESEWVADSIRKLPQYQSAKTLSCFVSMDKLEVDTNPLLRYCFEDKKKVYLPRIIGDNKDEMVMLQTLNLDEIYDENRFTISKWGISEPKLTYIHNIDNIDNNEESKNNKEIIRENAMDTLDLDLMIIPGVAFNENNYRMGHGKGYYDKYFSKYKQVILENKNNKFPYLIGIGLAANYNENIPIEHHDWILDQIVQFKEVNNN